MRPARSARLVHGLSSRIGAVTESFLKPVHRLELTVPATTSNLGPGFDCLSVALDLRNRIVVERAETFSMEIKGEGSWTLPRTRDNLVVRSTERALGFMEQQLPPLRFECHNAVPPRRGLGSSSCAIVAGFAAGLAFGGKELYTRERSSPRPPAPVPPPTDSRARWGGEEWGRGEGRGSDK